ncbi:MAG: ATP phosphoribosyltransferase [Methanosphaera sp.]|uniref:ATP phosphoribosyltransferase n=1 Tax=Methanosphaera sp. TaxID=2666342 RepID=UPI0025D2189D|nr:ATP phosphoribosyltransferase [Methanosphaera sp.]MCI5867589.1 ATP phosphoribosyltransferase [Methanosphaera sp.]MDY3956134.1 ATP phosphoribosyltransferase [Methanosphaera sp.]
MNIRIALPSKGRISGPAVELLEKAGIGLTDNSNRKLFSNTFDPEISVMFTRAADIPEYVADGAADIGITGYDLVCEKDVDVEMLEDLKFGATRLVVAVPEDSEYKTKEDIKKIKTIATEFPTITKKYLDENGIDAKILALSGATEVAPLIGIADAIADLTSTGTTLKMNHLREVDTIITSSVHLIANKESFKTKFEKIEEIKTGIIGVLHADGKKLLMVNVHKEDLDKVKDVIPGMGGPTVSEVYGDDNMVAVHSVISEKEVFSTINKLRKIGAKDLLVVPIERILEN